MTRAPLTFGFVVALSIAVPAQAPEPPLGDTRIAVQTLVREDIFAGMLQNDMTRLARSEKSIESLLASRPADRAELTAWQGYDGAHPRRCRPRGKTAGPVPHPSPPRRRALCRSDQARAGERWRLGHCGRFLCGALRPLAHRRTRRRMGTGIRRLQTVVGAAARRQSRSCRSIIAANCCRGWRRPRSGRGDSTKLARISIGCCRSCRTRRTRSARSSGKTSRPRVTRLA